MRKRTSWIIPILIVGVLALSVLFAWQEKQSLENGIWICAVDVGQGDCMVIQTADGNVLIDTGPDAAESTLRAYLKSHGFDSFAYMILSHPHDDHIGNADMILREFQIDRLLCSETQSTAQVWTDVSAALEEAQRDLDTEWIKPLEGDVYWVGRLRIEILHAPSNDGDGGNEDCLIVRLDYGDCSMLLTGDAEEKTEAHLIESVSAEKLSVDLLKIAHHGSSGSSSEMFLNAAHPTIAVISSGAGNTFGHPHAEVLQRLRKLNCGIYRTDTNGTLSFYCDGHQITYRPPM